MCLVKSGWRWAPVSAICIDLSPCVAFLNRSTFFRRVPLFGKRTWVVSDLIGTITLSYLPVNAAISEGTGRYRIQSNAIDTHSRNQCYSCFPNDWHLSPLLEAKTSCLLANTVSICLWARVAFLRIKSDCEDFHVIAHSHSHGEHLNFLPAFLSWAWLAASLIRLYSSSQNLLSNRSVATWIHTLLRMMSHIRKMWMIEMIAGV